MNIRKSIIFSLALVLTLGAGAALYDRDNQGQASVDQEVYKVGKRILVMGAEGDASMGAYTNSVPEGTNVKMGMNKASDQAEANVKTIALSFICVAENPLFKGVLPAFQKYWEETKGEKVNFVTGYAQLGFDTLTTSVFGQPVQVAIDVSGNDTQKLGFENGKAGNKGVIFYYPLTFLVRKGNPKIITTYEDLTKPGVQAIHADPIKSGGAGLYPVYGTYGSSLKLSEARYGRKDREAALEQLKIVEQNAILTDLNTTAVRDFLAGQGDVLLTTEGRALKAAKENDSVEVVMPPNTLLVDFSVFKMKKNIRKEDREVVDAFIDFLFTPEAQGYFAQFGFRPVDPDVLAQHPKFVPLQDPFRLDYLGKPIDLKMDLILDKWLKIKHFKKKDKPSEELDSALIEFTQGNNDSEVNEVIGVD